jgi:hypothetical protein
MGDWFIGNNYFHNKENNSISTDKQIFHHSTIPLFHLQIKNASLKSILFFRLVVYISTLQIDEFFDFRCYFLRTVNHMGLSLG